MPRLSFAISLLILAFAYGFAVGRKHWFPDSVIHSAASAANDLAENWRASVGKEPTRLLQPSRNLAAGVSRQDESAMAPGMTLVSSFFDGDVALAILAPDGKLVHRWPLRYFDLLDEREVATLGNRPQNNWGAPIMGATILPDGSVIFTFNNGGLIRLDKCGKVVWKHAYKTHHSVVVADDGTLWVPSVRHDYPVGERVDIPGFTAPFLEESILHLDASGKVIEEMSLPRMMLRNDLLGVLLANGDTLTTNVTSDYTHLNKIDVLSHAMAPRFPMFSEGDLLLSLRHLNLIMVVDPREWRVIWMQTGPWLRQHDAEFRGDGKISVFDNRADNQSGKSLGGSRIVAIDPATRALTVVYAGSKEAPFYTDVEGEHVYLPNSNILISESMAGRIFEVAPDGRIVWQYVNAFDAKRVVGETHAYARLAPEFIGRVDWSCRD